MGSAVGTITETLFGRTEQPDIPEPEIPAVAAPSRRQDTGAKVVVGSDSVKDARVSGRSSGTDALGGLGSGGLSI